MFIERLWIAVSPEGQEQTCHIRATFPVEQPTGAWTSRISIGAIDIGDNTVHGMDSWQAMSLAMSHTAALVRHLQRVGWSFFWDDADRETATHADL